MTLELAHIFPAGSLWYDTAEEYARAIERRGEGRIKVVIAHSGSTGDWPKSIEALKIGTNDIVLQSVGTLDRYGAIAGVEAYPYLIRDLQHFGRVYHGAVGRELYEEIERRTGFRLIGAGYRGAREVTSNRPVRTLADFKGLKLRVPPLRIYRLTWEYLGAIAVPMAPAELLTSLQQGVVDAQENPLDVIEAFKFNEVQKYLIETSHVLGAMTWIFSAQRFKSLPPDVQRILLEEGEASLLAATARMVDLEALARQRLQAKGMVFIAIDRGPLLDRLAPMVQDFADLAPWVRKVQAVR